ncbi:MAG: DNA polymerase III subunit alpha [SAR202 cluster bacterium]|nr:DNA polymerase III subunit alpha [SAR202 cluster bacterium]
MTDNHKFSHLHVHTEYSLLDGLSRLEQLVKRASELGMEALAITDHGGLYGAVDFYQIAKRHGVKPIIGCELYVSPSSRLERNPSDKRPYHLTVLAKNNTGYKNLVKLVTLAHLEGFYYRPRVDRESLEKYREGLIVMSGCPSGEVPRALIDGRLDDAKSSAEWYRNTFEDYYFEIMRHGDVPELPTINDGLLKLKEELDIGIVATNDAHYVLREHAPFQDILICIHTNTNVQDSKRLRMEEDSYYLKSPTEMVETYQDLPEAISNTNVIADKCNLELDFETLRLPEYKDTDGKTSIEFLTELCQEGLKSRVSNPGEKELDRLKYELSVIEDTHFPNYFLVVWDIARFVRHHDIFFAVRGSAAASLVLFCLGVTDINPLDFDLVFERFLNLERKEMPDIDMDFQDDRRDEVINYVVEKYGEDHVAQIITFGTLGARAAIRDSGRALAMPYPEVDRVAKLVPQKLHITLDEAVQSSGELAGLYQNDQAVNKLLDTAKGVEGLTRHSSTHAAGVVISKEPLEDYIPLQRPVKGFENGVNTTQYAMKPLADLGLLKMDFLGLANLTILARTRDLIEERTGQHLALTDIPLNDSKTFDLLSNGETVGVFQLESTGMTRYIQDLKPTSLGDVAAMIALYRPGPMEHIDTFIDAKHGRSEAYYPHEDLEEILKETYGVIVFQDQVLYIARRFAGYSLGEADVVRKAMGKKIPEIMAEERERFMDGALKQGYSQDVADRVFELVEPFAGYAFNKAHSISYGLISYWTAYFKANYTGEYMTSLLNAYSGNADRVSIAVGECLRLGIKVKGPDINSGEVEFSLYDEVDSELSIRFGMSSIKNVGVSTLEKLIDVRKQHGKFSSIEEMCRLADMTGLNRKALDSLIKVGAFDCFGDRTSILSVADRVVALAQSEAQLRNSDQTSMFDMFGESVQAPLTEIEIEEGYTTDNQKGEWELELLGVNLSSKDVLAFIAASADSTTVVSRDLIRQDMNREKIKIAGQIQSVSFRNTRNGKAFAIVNVGMLNGSVEVFVWEELLATTRELLRDGKSILISGIVKDRGEDQVSISAAEINEFMLSDLPVKPADNLAPQVESSLFSNEKPLAVVPETESIDSLKPAIVSTNGSDVSIGKKIETKSEQPSNSLPKRLLITIIESKKIEADRVLLNNLIRELLEHTGHDDLEMEVKTPNSVVKLAWPLIKVEATTELAEYVAEMLGDSGYVALVGH